MMNATIMERARLRRTERLIGEEALNAILTKRVIIFGVGGVGSWCAESLVRSGIRQLTIVDSDCVCVTNCNRQLVATSSTIGKPKVEVLKERLLDINPNAEIQALPMVYDDESAESFHIESYDYVIDAIDSLKDKAHLILHTTEIAHNIEEGILKGEGISKRLRLVSSMGAALRVDPLKIRVTEFWKVRNDTLGRAIRKRFKSRGQKPAMKFKCVYSEELPMENKGADLPCGTDICVCKGKSTNKAQINGTLSHITAIFGFTIAGLVIEDILSPSL